MARLTRKNIKVFAGNATNNGVFGSLQAENPVTTTNVEQIQSLPAWSVGWNSATMTSENLPPLEEFQGIQYVTTYQQAYLMQEGMPEWASTVTYYKGSLTKEVTANGFRIYCSLTDNNINHLLSDTTNWKKVMDSDDLYAFDNAVVHLAGNETITGNKTFSGNVKLTAQSGSPQSGLFISSDYTTYAVSVQNNSITKGTAPSSNSYCGIDFYGTATTNYANRLGLLEFRYETNKLTSASLCAFKSNAASDSVNARIAVYYPPTGNPYTEAPTPTDTTTTTGTQIATTGWVNSANNNVVHKTGNETISGAKTFSSDIIKQIDSLTYNGFRIQNTQVTKGTTPSEAVGGQYVFQDSTGQSLNSRLGGIETTYNANGVITTRILACQPVANSTTYASISVIYPASGNPYTEAPASDANNSIVTTINKSKAANGYFQLGNGLIIQWGVKSATTDNTTVTLPKAFTTTNYSVCATQQSSSDETRTNIATNTYTTTSFNLFAEVYERQQPLHWIAIGY